MKATWWPRDSGSACAADHTARAKVSARKGLWSDATSMSPTRAEMKVCSSRNSYSATLLMASIVCDSSTSIATTSSSTSARLMRLIAFSLDLGSLRAISPSTCSCSERMK